MTIRHEDLYQYARLLLKNGVNLQKRQGLHIRHTPGANEFAGFCARLAYEMGALNVTFECQDSLTLKARLDAQAKDEEALKSIPGWLYTQHQVIVNEQWAMLSLRSYDDVDIMKDVDQEALKTCEMNLMKHLEDFRNAVLSHSIPWSVAAFPSPEWAKRVLGKDAEVSDLWNVLIPILRLDHQNPCQAWKDQARLLQERAHKLNSLELETLHFTGGETDLKVGLNRKSRWMGGGEQSGKRMTMPNLPTEEVFTTPNRLKCEGQARVTYPVQVRGTLVHDIIFQFQDGLVTDFQARTGKDTLEKYLESDPGARRLGEVALVGQDSPIARSGYIFNSILLDENSSCHIALGAGYNSGLFEGEKLITPREKETAGCNHSLVHTDFMIGSPEISVTGKSFEGKETLIIRNGEFVI